MNTLVHMSGGQQRALYQLADDRYGYITAAIAREAGIAARQLSQLARRGTLEHVSQGVYRLVDFPVSELDSYMAASLWPQGVVGVLSHETALDLYKVCDISPISIHMTVPRAHRIRRAIPPSYEISHASIPAADIVLHEGIPMTSPARTLADCIDLGVGAYLIEQAIDRGRQSGLMNAREATVARRHLSGRGR